jgi:hypothetical protein
MNEIKFIEEILKETKRNGGATINKKKGNLSGKPFYAVSPFKIREKKIPVSKFNKKVVVEFLNSNKDLLKNPSNSIGTWKHEEYVFLDISATTPSLETAEKIAVENNQIAIFDLLELKEITVTEVKEMNFLSELREHKWLAYDYL